MEWQSLLSPKRIHPPHVPDASADERTPFERDVDRLVFASSFRRLSRKTQVHPLAANDHVHTRLTHSLEVARVGRALGSMLASKIRPNLPRDITANDLGSIVQAACLGHDLGNPPFGHAGEAAMSHWFELHGATLFAELSAEERRDLGAFDGNAQGFRMITQTENHLFQGGLRLTYATLGTFLKYPWTTQHHTHKFGAFLSEAAILGTVATELGLRSTGPDRWSRHPLAFLVEAADDICYAVLDLEDAVELRIVPFDEVEALLLSLFDEAEQRRIRNNFAAPSMHRVNLARLRGPVFDRLTGAALEGFMRGYPKIMDGTYEGDVFRLLPDDDPGRDFVARAKRFSAERVFPDTKKIEIELGAYATFESLLNAFCRAALQQAAYLEQPTKAKKVDWKSGLVLQLLSEHAPRPKNPPPGSSWTPYQCVRRVIDFVSGMTDNYAIYIAKQLQGTGFAGGQRP